MRLWDKLRQKDRVAELRAGLWQVAHAATGGSDADLYDRYWDDDCTDQQVRQQVLEAVQAVIKNHEEILATIKTADRLDVPFTPTHVVVLGSDPAGPLIMGCARSDGEGEFETRNLGTQPVTTPGGLRLRLPVVKNVLTLRFSQYTLIRGLGQGMAVRSLLAHEPGLSDVLGPASGPVSRV